ncbi:uncharacterized protein LOC117108423 [Anneissia japonica]|uniref:uncharacterized protein LOC117108423 n=1 Tax=Anneissia japonica TaxID=1529436 RepID=UPI001425A9E6|nr:uncharacterized protein LOC117108423 [Anneissia japonica]
MHRLDETILSPCKSRNGTFYGDIKESMDAVQWKLDRLKNMELFVLDNSLRETTVASLRAHTIENKRAIYDEIKKCGFKYFIVESFNHQARIGDLFLEELIAKGEDLSNAFAFSELWETIVDEVPQPDIPIGLQKCKQFGIHNVILEIDLVYYKIDYEKMNMDEVCKYLKDKIDWIRSNLSKDSLILLNFRDFTATMLQHPERVRHIVNYLASLPKRKRIMGVIFEDLGAGIPEQLAAWTRAVKNEMERCGWSDGQLLFHQHEQWGLMHAANLDVLASGATGMWAGLCIEGASLGHADTCTAILNLIRLGNKAVQKQYNCNYLRDAAINVTKAVTGGVKPNPKQPVYGDRATDMVYGFIFSDPTAQDGFDMAEFLGVKSEVRITNMANDEMILLKLEDVFGEDPQFTLEIAGKMKEQMLKNAADGRKEEYNSKIGLAMLFDQAGGKMTKEMADIIAEASKSLPFINTLIDEIKVEWDEWDGRRCEVVDDQLTFDHFYTGFMSPYFGCYRCKDTQQGLRALDMDADGMIDWFEFRHFLLWAGRQHPNVKTSKELLDIAFRDGLIPAMKDEMDRINKI